VSPGSGTPTGTVTFEDGSTVLGTANISAGTASFTTSSLSVGTHSIKAVYGGDTNFMASASAVLIQVVDLSSNVVVGGTNMPSLFDQAVGTLGDESQTDALVAELAALQVSAPRRPQGASAAMRG
jgi:Bacterial Ig-like domain (group 3)